MGIRQRKTVQGGVRRMHYLDPDVDRVTHRLAFEENASLAWIINRLLREALVARGLLGGVEGPERGDG
jgi:hypothetical protein